MKILRTNVFVGPNLYASFPVIRHHLDLGILEQWPSARIGSDFTDGLVAALPGLQEHRCSYTEAGGFIRRLTEDEGTWMGHIMEHVALEIQTAAGIEVGFGRTRGSGEIGQYNMVFQYKQRDVGLEASRLAFELLLNLLPEDLKHQLKDDGVKFDDDFDWDDELETFIRFSQRKEFGPSTGSLVRAAEERDIPWLRLNQYSLVQLGHGKYQQRIQATITSQTKHIGVEISCDKEDTHNLLHDLGLPVPRQMMIYSERQAIRAARRIGFPVVLKPLNANHGRGVSINLETDEQVAAGFAHASKHGTSRAVLVESFITGLDHRMLAVDGQLVACAKRVPGHVVGDGISTVNQLVDEVNEDPRRGIGHEKVLTRLEFDAQAERLLSEAGYDENTVLPRGETFYLRKTANLSTGGTAIDVTDIVHPDNKAMAERAIRAVGLDVGGVDFLTDDISQSYKDIGGAIVEVNAAPGFRMHVAPSEGESRDVAGAVMDMLFPPAMPSKIPIAAITGTNGKTTTARMLAHIMKAAGHITGMTSTDGVYIDGHLSVKGDMTGPTSAQIVLRDPMVDMAIMETARGGILRSGLGYSYSNVAACLNVSADHLGLGGIETVEELAEVKRVVVETATDTVVLNADDELCLKMADYCDAENVCYVTANPNHALVRAHIRSGGMAVVLEKGINGDMITIFDNDSHIPLLWTHLIPATMEGRAMHNVQNAMVAAALAYSLGKNLEDIRHGLRTFNTSFFQAPGRMNVFDEHPFKVILDYGHNPAAIKTVCETVQLMDTAGRNLVVLSAPGDRRDEDVEDIATNAAGYFDHYWCKADDNRRGRGEDEVPQLIRKALLKAGVEESKITIISDEQEAINSALNAAVLGDLVVIFGDNIARCWKQITRFSEHDDDEELTKTKKLSDETTPEPYQLEPGMRLVSDERGVRIAKQDEDSD